MDEQSGQNHKEWVKTLHISYNASGAALAAKRGDVVVIVDLIDMSTTAEAVLARGAHQVLGAAPAGVTPPVPVDPETIGFYVAKRAQTQKWELVLIAEPRWSTEDERRKRCQPVLKGIQKAGGGDIEIYPNIGAEVQKFRDFHNTIVLIISDTGGTAFDTALHHGAIEVLTATVTRIPGCVGSCPAEKSIKRVLSAARKHRRGITFVAASSNSYEDLLGAEYLAKKVIETGFLHH